ncbi:MAG: hypothetical protein BWX66_02003 [Deltaproteobacteria bacterium ADurb.Bin058]|nr:MAG: hypothetical protein BWX66_02003 [Deltaproteobacteria bacterium ADurb.Bin058]
MIVPVNAGLKIQVAIDVKSGHLIPDLTLIAQSTRPLIAIARKATIAVGPGPMQNIAAV